MTLPFSEQQFLDVFGRYNTREWPVVLLLWLATVWFVVQLMRGRSTSVALGLLLASGHEYPRAPLFAVPCPTTLLTCGVLLTAVPRVPIVASVVPIAWTVLAGSAAILLKVIPDAMLFIAGASVAMTAIAQRHGPSNRLLASPFEARRS